MAAALVALTGSYVAYPVEVAHDPAAERRELFQSGPKCQWVVQARPAGARLRTRFAQGWLLSVELVTLHHRLLRSPRRRLPLAPWLSCPLHTHVKRLRNHVDPSCTHPKQGLTHGPSEVPPGAVVRYLGGFGGYPSKRMTADGWVVALQRDDVVVHYGSQKGRLTYKWIEVRRESWRNIKMISIASGSATRTNLPALALFGTLGLAAQREPGTFLAVSYRDGDVLFRSAANIHQQRATFAGWPEGHPLAASRIHLEGVPLVGAPTPTGPNNSQDVLDSLSRLAELRGTGVLTEQEFLAKKAELLSRL